ncbi:hypothetical protein [Rufibacter hautae]|uniref:Uncharacterized protein n=1 Tax=Rufibacter hautae TaxID=2595005 RepID=A0A5B6T971_9BACT|nr:hypothetical protein [Rufibacter hautae]KAA3436746.1 hypothetical protein FOA19_20420 [Rufibacter hautae]
MTHSYRLDEQTSFRIQEIQLILAKKLNKRISKKFIIDKAILVLQEKMELMVEARQDGTE